MTKCDVKIISQSNAGVSRARNAGLEAAKGKYIAFIDSDDNIKPFHLEALINVIESTGSDLACSLYRNCKRHRDYKSQRFSSEMKILSFPDCDSYGKFSLSLHSCKETGKIKNFPLQCFVWGKLYKRELIDSMRFMSDMNGAEDVVFNVNYFRKAKSASVACVETYDYLQHAGSIMHEKNSDKVSRNLLNSLKASEIALKSEMDKGSFESCIALRAVLFIDKVTLLFKLNKKKYPMTLKLYGDFLQDNYTAFKSVKPRKWYYSFIDVLYKVYRRKWLAQAE